MDSPAGLDLATEIYLVHLFSRGCGACGGAVYTGPIDHSHVEVEATWDGTRWLIYIAAC
jgi:hypothetical protein